MNGNAVPATIWFILELMRNRALLSRVRSEVEEARLPGTPENLNLPNFDLTKLCSGQLLQSSYAETLRLYMAVGLMRIPSHKVYILGKWRFPQDHLIVMSNRTAHHNEENAKDTATPYASRNEAHSNQQKEHDKPRFSMEGLAGSWVPYGGGQHLCPGRFFAKNEMMAAFALISSAYDVELQDPGLKPEPDMAFFPIGMLPP
ncbi:MAG: hypothetical protein Q9175_007129 [Cornicularia normoerica]